MHFPSQSRGSGASILCPFINKWDKDTVSVSVLVYDTVKIVHSNGEYEEIPGRLTGVVNRRDQYDKLLSSIGNLVNLDVRVTDKHCTIRGSLSRFYHGSNLYILSRQETKAAIEQISALLGLDISYAKLTRIDVASNLIMDHPVSSYLKLLQSIPRYKKSLIGLPESPSLYFSTTQRKLLFYDKIHELRSKRVSVPAEFREANLLRYELRFNRHLPRQFSGKRVTCAMLYDERFYQKLVSRWLQEYKKIRKARKPKVGHRDITDCRVLNSYLATIGLEKVGADTMLDDLSIRRSSGHIGKTQHSRLKSKISALRSNEAHTVEHELARELDEKMQAAADYLHSQA